jgi:single-strand DNA-binding protein
MPNLNKVMLMGNLTRDPELRFTPKGTAVCKGALAINRTWKSEDGEKKEEVTFVDFTAWGKVAETIGQYFKKGKPIYLEGRLNLEKWEDKQTGQPRQKLAVVMESFQFIDSAVSGEGGERKQPAQQEQRQEKQPTGKKGGGHDYAEDPADTAPPVEDDVPF